MTDSWRNWAANATCSPARVLRPTTEEQLVDAVVAAGSGDAESGPGLRVAGAGHSFTPIACTDGTLLDLRNYRALLAADTGTGLVTVQAGMRLSRLNAELATLGLAMPNLGDVAYQTVAGAISTGTHGTGARLGNLSTAVAGLRLVAADGTVMSCSAAPAENPELFAAARVGLGALGVISTVTLQTVPAFTLHAVEETRRVDAVLAELDALVDGNDHFEFNWFPGTGYAMTKRNNRVPGPARRRGRVSAFMNDIMLSNVVFGTVCRAAVRVPPASAVLRAVVPRLGTSSYSDASHRVFTSPRLVRFVEMEYAMPRAAFSEVFERVRRVADPIAARVVFPVECRWVAADDIPLSPSSGRDTAYVAVHVVRGNPYEDYFRAVERILDSVGGRPHWGKVHYQTADVLAGRYPRWSEFRASRKLMDPAGLFSNPHLDRVLGPPPS
ncbi:MAG TPA: D-arabinono-1,4-lactone oxidase [Pseudonocardiaceae bacterium]|jgi:FAD-linked oxidoreductase